MVGIALWELPCSANLPFLGKVMWPPMDLRIGLLRSSALQNDGRIKPVILQCRTPGKTNPEGHWGPNDFFIKS